MNHAPSKFEQGLPRIAVPFVLPDGIVDRLLGQAVFQFERHHRQTVDERTQVQSSLCLFGTVSKLPRNTESVLCMPLDRLFIFRRWSAVEQVEAQSAVPDAVSQDVDGPTARDFPLQASEELLASDVLPILEIHNSEFRCHIRLCGVQERKQLLDVHSHITIVGPGTTSTPAAATRVRRGLAHHVRFTGQAIDASHVTHDQRFEGLFGSVGLHFSQFMPTSESHPPSRRAFQAIPIWRAEKRFFLSFQAYVFATTSSTDVAHS